MSAVPYASYFLVPAFLTRILEQYKFNVDPGAIDELLENLDRDLKFAIEEEGGKKMAHVLDYEEQKQKIVDQLLALRATPKREEKPYIYHLDVAAMYPNIILTNRLQPPAMVTKQTCASCDFYHPEMKCRREMDWQCEHAYTHEHARVRIHMHMYTLVFSCKSKYLFISC